MNFRKETKPFYFVDSFFNPLDPNKGKFYFLATPQELKDKKAAPRMGIEIEVHLIPPNSTAYEKIKLFLYENNLNGIKYLSSTNYHSPSMEIVAQNTYPPNPQSSYNVSQIDAMKLNRHSVSMMFGKFIGPNTTPIIYGVCDEADNMKEFQTAPMTNDFLNQYGFIELQRFCYYARIFGAMKTAENSSIHLHLDLTQFGTVKAEQEMAVERYLRFLFINRKYMEDIVGRHPNDFVRASMDFFLGNPINNINIRDLVYSFITSKRLFIENLRKEQGTDNERQGSFFYHDKSFISKGIFNIVSYANSKPVLEKRWYGFEPDYIFIAGIMQSYFSAVAFARQYESLNFNSFVMKEVQTEKDPQTLKDYFNFVIENKDTYPFFILYMKRIPAYAEYFKDVTVEKELFEDETVIDHNFYDVLIAKVIEEETVVNEVLTVSEEEEFIEEEEWGDEW